MFKIPFSLYPYSWGTKGKTREIARAEYELTGYDLEYRLLTIRRDELTEDELSKYIWDLQLKYNKISKDEYYRLCITLIKDKKQAEIATLELDFREGKVTDNEYQRRVANIKEEPWVTVLSMNFDKKNSLEGSFELDWNDFFIEKLKADGYQAPSEDLIVNQWFMEVCRNVALEEFDGTGNFTSDSEANLEAMKRWTSESIPEGRKGYV